MTDSLNCKLWSLINNVNLFKLIFFRFNLLRSTAIDSKDIIIPYDALLPLPNPVHFQVSNLLYYTLKWIKFFFNRIRNLLLAIPNSLTLIWDLAIAYEAYTLFCWNYLSVCGRKIVKYINICTALSSKFFFRARTKFNVVQLTKSLFFSLHREKEKRFNHVYAVQPHIALIKFGLRTKIHFHYIF